MSAGFHCNPLSKGVKPPVEHAEVHERDVRGTFAAAQELCFREERRRTCRRIRTALSGNLDAASGQEHWWHMLRMLLLQADGCAFAPRSRLPSARQWQFRRSSLLRTSGTVGQAFARRAKNPPKFENVLPSWEWPSTCERFSCQCSMSTYGCEPVS